VSPAAQIIASARPVLERAQDVGLVSLATAPPPLAWRIVRDGALILEREPGAWNRIRVAIAIAHDDLPYDTQRALAHQRRVLAAGARE
jgi:hypothetical protein